MGLFTYQARTLQNCETKRIAQWGHTVGHNAPAQCPGQKQKSNDLEKMLRARPESRVPRDTQERRESLINLRHEEVPLRLIYLVILRHLLIIALLYNTQ